MENLELMNLTPDKMTVRTNRTDRTMFTVCS